MKLSDTRNYSQSTNDDNLSFYIKGRDKALNECLTYHPMYQISHKRKFFTHNFFFPLPLLRVPLVFELRNIVSILVISTHNKHPTP